MGLHGKNIRCSLRRMRLMLILQEVERIRRAGLGRIPFIYFMKMKDRGQVLSRNSMGSVEAVMHCLVPMIHTQTMMEKDCFLQEVLMGIRIRQFYYNVVMRHICNIREKIEDDPGHPVYIQTVRGVGYRFNGNLGSE